MPSDERQSNLHGVFLLTLLSSHISSSAMIEYGYHELIEDERQRFETAIAAHLGWKVSSVRSARDGDGYGDRMYLVIAWWSWLVAVGLTPVAPRDRSNEHAVVDAHGQPLPIEL